MCVKGRKRKTKGERERENVAGKENERERAKEGEREWSCGFLVRSSVFVPISESVGERE